MPKGRQNTGNRAIAGIKSGAARNEERDAEEWVEQLLNPISCKPVRHPDFSLNFTEPAKLHETLTAGVYEPALTTSGIVLALEPDQDDAVNVWYPKEHTSKRPEYSIIDGQKYVLTSKYNGWAGNRTVRVNTVGWRVAVETKNFSTKHVEVAMVPYLKDGCDGVLKNALSNKNFEEFKSNPGAIVESHTLGPTTPLVLEMSSLDADYRGSDFVNGKLDVPSASMVGWCIWFEGLTDQCSAGSGVTPTTFDGDLVTIDMYWNVEYTSYVGDDIFAQPQRDVGSYSPYAFETGRHLKAQIPTGVATSRSGGLAELADVAVRAVKAVAGGNLVNGALIAGTYAAQKVYSLIA